jgi:hypothetical protein
VLIAQLPDGIFFKPKIQIFGKFCL